MSSVLGKDLGQCIFYCADRVANLSSQIATEYEDDSDAPIAKELVEISYILRLCIVSLDKKYVKIQGEDYYPTNEGQSELPF